MPDTKILITGGGGQLGSVLTAALNKKYGAENVLVTDVRELHLSENKTEQLNVVQYDEVIRIINKHKPTQIYHLAAILSAIGEKNISKTRKVNASGFFNILQASVEANVDKVFFPSSIAVFGPNLPKHTPQDVPLNPTTVYGITKADGENWVQYFHQRYGLDVRSIRYPGVIGYQSEPGGGTTDYAVTIFEAALKGETFQCFLEKDEKLPMIYMEDAIRATIELMSADMDRIKTRTSYNLSGLSFTPEEIYTKICEQIPDFKIEYTPDERQKIAASWPDTILDEEAQNDWNWRPEYDLDAIVKDMLKNLKIKSPQIS